MDTSTVTDTTSLDNALPPTETANMERRNTVDNLNVEADSLSLGKIIFFWQFPCS